MAIQSDENGFLVGEPIQDIKRVSKNTSALLKEVKEIKKALGIKPNETQPRPVNPPAPPASNSGDSNNEGSQSRARNSGSNNQSGGESANNQQAQNNSGSQTGNTGNAGSSANANSQSGSSSQSVNPSPYKDTKDGGNGLSGMFDSLGDRITTALDTQGLEEVDPTVKAFQETVEPLAKGYQFLFGSGNNKKDKPYFAWFRRLWNTLKSINKNTAENLGGESGGGFLGFISQILPLLGSFLPVLGSIALGVLGALGLTALYNKYKDNPVVKKVVETASKAHEKATDWTSRNVVEPVAEFANDPEKWIKEKKEAMSNNISDATDSIEKTFENMGKKWEEFIGKAKEKWESITNIFENMYKGLKEMPVIGPLIQKAEDALNKLKESVNPPIDPNTGKPQTSPFAKGWAATKGWLNNNVVNPIGNAKDKVIDLTSRNVVEPVANAHTKAVDWTSRNVVEPVAGSLSSIIKGGESGKEGYNAYNRGTKDGKILGSVGHRDLENMTIAEIMADQARSKEDRQRLFAVGKYQMIPGTLKGGVEALGLDPNTTKFDKDTQEKLFANYLLDKKRPQISSYIKGKTDNATAAGTAAASEWASIADPRTGKGMYGDGNHVSISAGNLKSGMDTARAKYKEYIAQGMKDDEAYQKAVSSSMTQPSVTPEQIAAAAPKSPAVTASTIAVSNPAPVMPAMPKAPKIAETTPTILPLISKDSRAAPAPIMVSEIGQDLPDRTLAHIATGGISGI